MISHLMPQSVFCSPSPPPLKNWEIASYEFARDNKRQEVSLTIWTINRSTFEQSRDLGLNESWFLNIFKQNVNHTMQ